MIGVLVDVGGFGVTVAFVTPGAVVVLVTFAGASVVGEAGLSVDGAEVLRLGIGVELFIVVGLSVVGTEVEGASVGAAVVEFTGTLVELVMVDVGATVGASVPLDGAAVLGASVLFGGTAVGLDVFGGGVVGTPVVGMIDGIGVMGAEPLLKKRTPFLVTVGSTPFGFFT